jgi:hypothetical protein
MFRAALNLFGKWDLTDEQAADLLDMPLRSYRRWKAEGPGRISTRRAGAPVQPHGHSQGAADYLFRGPTRLCMDEGKQRNAFAGASALDVMLGGELTDIMRVRRYLDAARGGW